MKSLFSLLFLFITLSPAFSQKTKTVNFDSLEFRPKGQTVINMKTLSDGDHSYFSESGAKMILTVKNKKVTDQKFFSPTGAQISRKSIGDLFKKTCKSCVTIKFPDGHSEQLCKDVECGAGPINGRL